MKKKDWITKTEEKQIIRAYEGFKGEIIPYGDPSEHMYEITTVRKAGQHSLGIITIDPEYSPEHDYPRILVHHSDATGKRTFTDVWDRDWNGRIYWRFRNPVGVPISDRDYIEEMEDKASAAEGKVLILQKKYQYIVETRSATKPAGRPPHPEKLDEKATKLKELLDQGFSENEVMSKMNISRATFYRLKGRLT